MNYPVAVIIPVYKNDTPQYVRPAIDSIIKQTYSCRIYRSRWSHRKFLKFMSGSV